ncbi:WSCD family member AGAP003962, partial [Geodia barretti]
MNRSSAPQPVTQHSEGIEATQDCAQKNCLEYLSDSEKRSVSACARRVRTKDHYKGPIRQNECKFLPSSGRGPGPVALVSARGSGNTWTRGLLEKATGICTGFISCDTAMRAHGYVGENVKSGKVLVVKTHSVVPKWQGEKNSHAKPDDARYTSAVLILRNPAESAIAEWNRRSAEKVLGKHNFSIARERHTYTIPKEFFEGKGWDSFLHKYMRDWSTRLHQWVINQDNHPVHILHYEDLKQDTVGEIAKTLHFLNVSYDSDILRSKLSVDYSEFQRPHDSEDFEHYSLEQKEFLRSVLLEAKEAAERASKANLLQLDKYICLLSSTFTLTQTK